MKGGVAAAQVLLLQGATILHGKASLLDLSNSFDLGQGNDFDFLEQIFTPELDRLVNHFFYKEKIGRM